MKKGETITLAATVSTLCGSYLPWVSVGRGTLAMETPLEGLGVSPPRIYLIVAVIGTAIIFSFTQNERTRASLCFAVGLAAFLTVGYAFYGLTWTEKSLSIGSCVVLTGGILYLLSSSMHYFRFGGRTRG